jgi:hypothetical protein
MQATTLDTFNWLVEFFEPTDTSIISDTEIYRLYSTCCAKKNIHPMDHFFVADLVSRTYDDANLAIITDKKDAPRYYMLKSAPHKRCLDISRVISTLPASEDLEYFNVVAQIFWDRVYSMRTNPSIDLEYGIQVLTALPPFNPSIVIRIQDFMTNHFISTVTKDEIPTLKAMEQILLRYVSENEMYIRALLTKIQKLTKLQ